MQKVVFAVCKYNYKCKYNYVIGKKIVFQMSRLILMGNDTQ